MNIEIPVLIVGAGPVGLTLAAQLSYYGIPCRIIDQKQEPTQTSNAVAIHARTLELLQPLGISQQLITKGRQVHSAIIGSERKILAEWDFTKLASPFPFVLCIPQRETEGILINYLQQQGIAVERNIEFKGIEQNQDRVMTKIDDGQEHHTIHSQWLVACDGYHSTVRRALHVNYEARETELRFIMIDAPIETTQSLDHVFAFFHKKITLMLFPMPNSVRMIAEVSHDPRYRNVETPNEKLFATLCAETLPFTVKIGTPLWNSKFWIHEKLLDEFQCERVFFAGDAAHAHSPAGGQGMNTGMQDVINLAWKLALVIKQQAKLNLLTSYQQERWPVAEQVIHMSRQLTKFATSRNFFMNKLRNTLLPILGKKTFAQKKLTNEISELNVNYRKSAIIAGKGSKIIAPGDRAPDALLTVHNKKIFLFALLSGKKHVLLNFSDQASANELIQNHYPHLIEHIPIAKMDLEIRQRYNMTEKTGYCLIRPDHYIGYLGDDLQQLSDLLASYLITK